MRKMLVSSAAAILCAAAVPAVAAPASQDSSQSGAQSGRSAPSRANDPNRRVCVNAQLSDSRMRRRICRTQAEWDALQQNDDPSMIH